jgi:hypothetical protein
MPRYHINLTTGDVGACKATFKCPFGDIDKDHYDAPSDAREAYERIMEKEIVSAPALSWSDRPLGAPITLPPSTLWLPSSNSARSSVDYDYDSYRCAEIGGCTESYCHNQRYEGLRITGWAPDAEGETLDGFANYVKETLHLPEDEPLPPELRQRLSRFADFTPQELFEIEAESEFYGETITVTPIPPLNKELTDYYYEQPNAVDGQYGILPYVRGKGFDTSGLRPLEALKASLNAENSGRTSKKVERARKFRAATIALSSITLPVARRVEYALKEPRKAESVKASGQTRPIAGVVYEVSPGKYELIDGYRRHAHYTGQTNRKRAEYIILSGEPMGYRDSYSGWTEDGERA